MRTSLRVNVITLGCAKNIVDSEVMLRQLQDAGIAVVSEKAGFNGDAVIINTCGFINDAKQESVDTILEAIEAKKAGLVRKVIVCGCLSKRYGEALKPAMPEVDAYFGLNDITGIMKFLTISTGHPQIEKRILITPAHYAYLKISEGCNRKCSFCAIPGIRGKQVSRRPESLLREAENLVSQGVKELIIIAQDTTTYGSDLNRKKMLGNLMEQLSLMDGAEWIRLQYAYPASFPEDVLSAINEHPNICRYIDIPIQHISDKILTSMARGIGKKTTIKLLEKIRAEVRGVNIRTTIIVGYPGETEKDFRELMDFVRDFRFERLGAFMYSHEEGTPAFKLKDNIPTRIKQQRLDALMQLQQEISYKHNVELIGSAQKVLIDRAEGVQMIGRTEFDSPEVDNEVIIMPGKRTKLKPGDFCNVKITGADAFDLRGIAL